MEIMLAAGSSIAALTLIVELFLSSEAVLWKLKKELEIALPGLNKIMALQSAESLPQLLSITKVYLRLSYRVSARLVPV